MRYPVHASLTLVATFLVAACDSSNLAGGGASKAKKDGTAGGGTGGSGSASSSGSSATDAADGGSGTTAPSGSGTVDTGVGGPENSNLPPLVPTVLDDHGIVKAQCKDIAPLPTTSVSLKELWHWVPTGTASAFKGVAATPVVGPLKSSDKIPTVIAVGFQECKSEVTQSAHLFAINGKTGAQIWASDLLVHAWLSPALGDLDGDGSNEIVAYGMDGFIHALSADGSEKWVSTVKPFKTTGETQTLWPQGLSVADIGEDGKPVVIAGRMILDGKTGALKFGIASTGGGHTIVGNYDGKKGLEVIASDGVYSGADGKKVCGFAHPIEEPAMAWMKADATTATVIGINQTGIYLYQGLDCHQSAFTTKTSSGGGPINIADFDGDGSLDFGTAGRDEYMAFDSQGRSLWTKPTQDHSSQVTGSTTFDFNGDGKNEIIYADELKVRIMSGLDGSLIYEAPHTSYTVRETPAVVDVDGDGTANIVVASNYCSNPSATNAQSGIYAYQETNNKWVSTRPIWNQHAYNPLLVSSTGSLTGVDPATIYKPWLSAAYLVGFRNNVPKPAIKADCQ